MRPLLVSLIIAAATIAIVSAVVAAISQGGEPKAKTIDEAAEKKLSPALRQRFDEAVQPILTANCVTCHGPNRQKGGVTLHDISIDPADTKAVARWSQVLEQLECGLMPPEDRSQPTARQKQDIVDWISDYLTAAGKGFELRSKWLLPEYGNRVNHELLFDGTIKDMPSSPSRLWRISPYIFAGKGYQAGPGPKAEPIAFSTKTDGIRDYSSQEIVGEAGLLALMMTFDDLISRQMHDDKNSAANPSFKAVAQAKGVPPVEAMEKVIREEFLRAMSRPINDEELARYVTFMTNSIKQAGNESGLKIAVMAIYLSPEAIYRMELGLGKEDEHGRRLLSSREIAFAISYAFTDLPPSKVPIIQDALEKNQLSTKADVERVARQLIADGAPPTRLGLPGVYDAMRAQGRRGYAYYPRVLRFFEEFFEYPKVAGVFKDSKRGSFGPRATPGITQGTIASIVNDDRNVFHELLCSPRFNDSRDRLLEIIDADRREKLKPLLEAQKQSAVKQYEQLRRDIEQDPKGENPEARVLSLRIDEIVKQYEKKKREIEARPKDENFRTGVLTDPSWLMVHAKCVANDPVRRGKWVRERLLAGNVPELPIGVEAKIPEDHDRTLRERFEVVNHADCWKCHKHMNPLGMPFESYDDFGRFRTGLYYDPKRKEFLEQPEWERIAKAKDNGIIARPVDATGYLSGTGDPALDGEVKDAVDLVTRLAKSPRVRQSIIRHAFRYWIGRNETLSDSRTLIAAEQAYINSGGKFSEVIVALVTSDSFLFRK